MNVIDWLLVISVSLQLFNKTSLDDYTDLICKREAVSTYWNTDEPDSELLVVELRSSENQILYSKYLIVLKQNLYSKTYSDQLRMFMEPDLIFVSDKVMIFRKNSSDISAGINKNTFELNDFLYTLFDYDQNIELISENNSFTTPDGAQVIRMQEYKNYISMEIATTGSAAVRPIIPEGIPEGKMIRMILVPDTGPSKEMWLTNKTDSAEMQCIQQTESDIINTLFTNLNSCIVNPDRDNIELLSENTITLIEEIINTSGCENITDVNYYRSFTKKLMTLEDIQTVYDINTFFPDYQPKLTPDIVTDYNPSVSGDLLLLPSAEKSNLVSLIDKYNGFSKKASKNPGKWEHGNLILGAPEFEYRPSNEELVLAEIGTRITEIISNTDISEITSILKEYKCKTKKISFKTFTFYHMDVMGSGRFFYVDHIIEYSVNLITGEIIKK